MPTGLDFITDSLQKIGVYAPGEAISDADAERCLSVMNDMLDSWSNESLTCFAILEQSGPMQVGVNAYTIGPGGTFNMVRPLKILDGPGTCYLMDSNNQNYPVTVVARDQWNLIGQRTGITSNVPDTLFYDPQYPLGIINVFPTPNISYTLFWDSYLQLSDVSNLAATISLPPGYRKAIQDSLAIEIWPYFKSGDPPQSLLMIASKSKGNIKRTNIRPNVAVFEKEIVSKASGTYNIYTDNTGR